MLAVAPEGVKKRLPGAAVSELGPRSPAERCGNSNLRDVRRVAYLREARFGPRRRRKWRGGDTVTTRASARGGGSSGGAPGGRASGCAGQLVSSGRGGHRL